MDIYIIDAYVYDILVCRKTLYLALSFDKRFINFNLFASKYTKLW